MVEVGWRFRERGGGGVFGVRIRGRGRGRGGRCMGGVERIPHHVRLLVSLPSPMQEHLFNNGGDFLFQPMHAASGASVGLDEDILWSRSASSGGKPFGRRDMATFGDDLLQTEAFLQTTRGEIYVLGNAYRKRQAGGWLATESRSVLLPLALLGGPRIWARQGDSFLIL